MAKEYAARKDAKFIVISIVPDVCLTPPVPVPIPYQVVSFLNESIDTASTVHFSGNEAFIHNRSLISRTIGDEPGTQGGIITGTVSGICTSIQYSPDTYIEGNQLVRVNDLFFMNG